MKLGGVPKEGLIRSLNQTSATLSSLYERLSSGMRINHASDDAAGLSIAEKLNADTIIYSQAIRNVSDGISLTNVTLGAMDQMVGILQRQLELATEAANGTYSASQRKALDLEAAKLSDEFNRILGSTSFNGINPFDVNAAPVLLAVGKGLEETRQLPQLFQGGTAGSSTWDGTYTHTGYAVAGNAAFVGAGDFNGDGFTDLVTGNSSNTNVTIMYNLGNGQFGNATTISDPGTAIGITAADLNNDGKADIIAKNQNGTSSVFLNNGSGGFSRSDYGSGIGTYGTITVGDLNNDGFLDYAAYGSSASPQVFLNQGNGLFTVSQTLTPGFSPGIGFGDVNNDGYKDIIASNDGTGNSTIYLNQRNGTFAAGGTITGVGGNGVDTADINGDGKIDVVAGGWTTGALTWALGNGDGTFRAARSLSLGGVVTNETKLADLNGDRFMDVIMSGYGSGTILAFMNDGAGNYTQTFAPELADTSAWGVAAADFNNDLVTDLVGISYNTGFHVMLGGTRNQQLPYFDLRTQSTARKAIDGINYRMSKISQVIGELGAAQSRLDVVSNVLSARTLALTQAEGRIRNADIAESAAETLKLTIKQQASSALLGNISRQDRDAIAVVLGL